MENINGNIPAEIENIIRKSGNTFHAKVAQALKCEGWLVRVSPFYVDQNQNKSREIDIIAEKAYEVRNENNIISGHVVVRLFVECKFIPAHTVFWMAEKDLSSAEQLIHQTNIFDLNNVFVKKHHYLSDSLDVAKVFSSESQRESENDPFFKALNQTLQGYVALRHQPPIIGRNPKERIRELARLTYPVIFCSSFDKIYKVPFYGDASPQRISGNFQIEAQYAYTIRGSILDEYFLIDVVDFNEVRYFLDSIEGDANLAGFFKG